MVKTRTKKYKRKGGSLTKKGSLTKEGSLTNLVERYHAMPDDVRGVISRKVNAIPIIAQQNNELLGKAGRNGDL